MEENIKKPQPSPDPLLPEDGSLQNSTRTSKFFGSVAIILGLVIGYAALANFEHWFPLGSQKNANYTVSVSTPTVTPYPWLVFTPTPNSGFVNLEDKTILSKDGQSYVLESIWGPPEKENQKLLIKNQTTKKEKMIDIWKAIPALDSRLFLEEIAVPLNSNVIIFQSFLPDTDNPGGSLYSFDLNTEQFKYLNLNQTYDGFFGGFALSPDQKRFIWMPAENLAAEGISNKMYVCDLISDDCKLLVTLSGSETFNEAYQMDANYEINWLDNDHVKYGVFDSTKKVGQPSNETDPSIADQRRIAYREITL